MFGALKCGFRSMASLMLVRNVVGELKPKRTLAASRGFLAAARLSCSIFYSIISKLRCGLKPFGFAHTRYVSYVTLQKKY